MQLKQNKQQQKKPTKWLIIIAIVVIALLGYGLLANTQQLWPFNGKQGSESTTRQPSGTVEENPADAQNDSPESKTPEQYEKPKNEEQSDAISGIINYKSTENNTLTLRVTIDQALESGTCTLSLTNPSTQQKVNKTANLMTNPSSSTCTGFDVPLSELQSGVWKIKIMIAADSKSGEITYEVSI